MSVIDESPLFPPVPQWAGVGYPVVAQPGARGAHRSRGHHHAQEGDRLPDSTTSQFITIPALPGTPLVPPVGSPPDCRRAYRQALPAGPIAGGGGNGGPLWQQDHVASQQHLHHLYGGGGGGSDRGLSPSPFGGAQGYPSPPDPGLADGLFGRSAQAVAGHPVRNGSNNGHLSDQLDPLHQLFLGSGSPNLVFDDPVLYPRSPCSLAGGSSRAGSLSPGPGALPILPESLAGLEESALQGILDGSASCEQISLVLRVLEQSRKLKEEERRSREEKRRWSEVQLAILRELKTSPDTCGEGIDALLNNHLQSSPFSSTNNVCELTNATVPVASSAALFASSPAALVAAPALLPTASLLDGLEFSPAPSTGAATVDASLDGVDWDALFANPSDVVGSSFSGVTAVSAAAGQQLAAVPAAALTATPGSEVSSSPLTAFLSEASIAGLEALIAPNLASASAVVTFDELMLDALLKPEPVDVKPDLSFTALLNDLVSTSPQQPQQVVPAPVPSQRQVAKPRSTRKPLPAVAASAPSTAPLAGCTVPGANTTIPIVSAVHRVSMMGQKMVVEEPSACRRCCSPLATMILRGKPATLEAGSYTIDVICASCALLPDTDSTTSPDAVVVPSRKRARGRTEDLVNCDVCRRHVGSGGVKVSRCSDNKKRALASAADAPVAAAAAEFSVEVVCVPCRERYAFCTECGGGGKYRTGKYRPIELFTEGRRTCRLSHVRFGDAAVSYRVWDTVADGPRFTDAVMGEARAVFDDGVTSFFASPRAMEHSTRCGSIDAIQREIAGAWSAVENGMRGVSVPRSRYMASAYIPRIPRKKTRTTRAVPVKVDAAEETAAPPCAQEHVQAAFLTAQADVSRRALVVDQIGARMMAMQSATLARDLVARCLGRAQRDAAGAIDHVCVVVPAGEERLAGFCAKLGAVPVEVYLRRQRVVHSRAAFEGMGVGMEVFVISAAELENAVRA
ncbi:hypothetical protein HDU96_004205 [Phlyctochytrium bullatum]|nr:hypothetical protein HDU96_004205 [Phlyctochytrium bullatum]